MIGFSVHFFFSSRRRHTRLSGDWSSDVCSSDLSDRRVPADWGQESQASTWVEAWNSACLSRCPWGERPLVELYLEPGGFPNDARKNCPFVWTSFTGWSSERCPGIGFLSRGDREIGVLRNVEPPTRPRLECLRETGLILTCDRKVGNPF